MSKRKLYYSARVAKKVTVDVKEFEWSALTITNTFMRKDVGETSMLKPAKGEVFDLTDKDVRVFAMLDVESQEELIVRELGVLNACDGFKESITVDGDTFTPMNGLQCRCVGSSLEFRVV